MYPLVTVEPIEKCVPSAFDALFTRNVPHILESIFFSLDYKSFKNCMKVNAAWKELFSTARYQMKLEEKLSEKMENEKKLYFASEDGDSEEIRRLIKDHMVDVNFEMGQDKATPLIMAAARGHKEVVQMLLHAGADIDRGDRWGETPLTLAAFCHHYETVKLLLEAGADVNNADIFGKIPLWMARDSVEVEVAKLLLEHGADPNKADKDGETPLHEAVRYCQVLSGTVKTLIKGGADPLQENKLGKTPQDLPQGDMLKLLLEAKSPTDHM